MTVSNPGPGELIERMKHKQRIQMVFEGYISGLDIEQTMLPVYGNGQPVNRVVMVRLVDLQFADGQAEFSVPIHIIKEIEEVGETGG